MFSMPGGSGWPARTTGMSIVRITGTGMSTAGGGGSAGGGGGGGGAAAGGGGGAAGLSRRERPAPAAAGASGSAGGAGLRSPSLTAGWRRVGSQRR